MALPEDLKPMPVGTGNETVLQEQVSAQIGENAARLEKLIKNWTRPQPQIVSAFPPSSLSPTTQTPPTTLPAVPPPSQKEVAPSVSDPDKKRPQAAPVTVYKKRQEKKRRLGGLM